jgi:hypothetical protein
MKKINLISGVFLVAIILGMSFTSCTSSNNTPTASKGTDPSTIATADLVAYFPFNGNGNDSITGMTPVKMPNVTYVTAKRKSGFQGVNNAYFLYNLPTSSKLRTLKAFTVSMWLNEPPAPGDVVPTPLLMQITNDSDQIWGNLTLNQDRLGTVALPVDSINLKAIFQKFGVPYNLQFINFPNPAIRANNWIHLIFEYDNATSTFNIFVNGVKLSIPPGWTNRFTDGTSNTPLGDLNFVHASQLVFGAWMQEVTGVGAVNTWQGWFTGIMDELRIYDRALTATEAKALYDAEVTQLNP